MPHWEQGVLCLFVEGTGLVPCNLHKKDTAGKRSINSKDKFCFGLPQAAVCSAAIPGFHYLGLWNF